MNYLPTSPFLVPAFCQAAVWAGVFPEFSEIVIGSEMPIIILLGWDVGKLFYLLSQMNGRPVWDLSSSSVFVPIHSFGGKNAPGNEIHCVQNLYPLKSNVASLG